MNYDEKGNAVRDARVRAKQDLSGFNKVIDELSKIRDRDRSSRQQRAASRGSAAVASKNKS